MADRPNSEKHKEIRASRDAAGVDTGYRRTVDFRVLVVSLIAVALLGGGVALLRVYQQSRMIGFIKQRADNLAADEDWSGAGFYLKRYLQLKPDDLEARLQLVRVAEQQVESGGNRDSLVRLLYETVGMNSVDSAKSKELHGVLAEQLLQGGDFLGASEAAQEAVGSDDPAVASKAKRVWALSQLYRVPAMGSVSDLQRRKALEEVVPHLNDALAENPGDVVLATATAQVYRVNPLLDTASSGDTTATADGIMDRLVEQSPDRVDALLARSQYRKQYSLDGVVSDLESARQLDSEDYRVNVLLAIETFLQREEDSVEKAERYLRAAIDAEPALEKAHVLLAEVKLRSAEIDQAIEVLETATRQVPSTAVEVPFMLADLYLLKGNIEAARESADSLRKAIERQLAAMPTQVGRQLQDQLRLLEANISMRDGDPSSALAIYDAVSTSSSGRGTAQESRVSTLAIRGQAEALSAVGRWDQAAVRWSMLADERAESRAAAGAIDVATGKIDERSVLADEESGFRLQAGRAFLRAGLVAKSIEQLGELTGAAKADALETRLLAELALQLDSLPANRNWEQFRSLLAEAQDALPASDPVYYVQLNYLLASRNSSDDEIHQVVESGEERFGESPAYWRIAAQALVELGRVDEAEDAIKRFMQLEVSREQRSAAWVAFLASVDRNDEALSWLGSQAADANDAERLVLRRLEVKLLARTSKLEESLAKAVALAEETRKTADVVVALELAAVNQDWEAAEELEGLGGDLSGAAADEIAYLKGVRLLRTYETLSPDEHAELDRLAIQIRNQRPSWYKAAELAARVAEASGDHALSTRNYKRAVELGDRRPATLERLAVLLFDDGQFEEAQRVINRLLSSPEPASLGVESLAISNAVKGRRVDEALSLAEKAVSEHPEDASRRLLLYNVMRLDGRSGDADLLLAQAREDFPESEVLWNAQFGAFVNAGLSEEARKLLDELPSSLRGNEFARNATLARGHELLGNVTTARKHYRTAIQLRPSEVGVRTQYASLLLKHDPAAAREQFEEVLKQQPNQAEARRALATLLAASGTDADWDRIDQLLSGAGGDGEAVDRRLRAVLLTRRGRSIEERAANTDLARRIFVSLVEGADADPTGIDRLLLASAYEQEAILKKDPVLLESARSQLRYLLRERAQNDEFAVAYIKFLLRSASSLEEMDSASSSRDVFLADAETRIASLLRNSENDASVAGLTKRQSLLGLQVKLLHSQGELEEAEELVDGFVSSTVGVEGDESLKAKLLLGSASLYSELGLHAKAEPLLKELVKMAPGAKLLLSQSLINQGRSRDAVDLFLEDDSDSMSPKQAATVASVLTAAGASETDYEATWPGIAAALQNHPQDVDLLLAVAVLQVTRGDEAEAIQLFRRVLEVEPEHPLALNNLATLLGERDRDRAEALSVVAQAIRVAGRKPALLDTQGTIQLQLGDADAAISSLEESVANVNVDPRYYFHLAAAYWRGGRSEAALEALGEARRRGIDKAVLTTADRKLMRELETALENSGTVSLEAS